MTNIKKELDEVMISIGKEPNDIIDLYIRYSPYSRVEYKEFNHYYSIPLNINYDSGFGSQELYGCVVFNDDSWLERYEYDGSECWDYKSLKKVIDYINESRKGGQK